MKNKIIKNLIAVKNAFDAYKKGFNRKLTCEKLFENFTQSLDEELGVYKIKYDYLCGKETCNVDGQSKGCFLSDGDTILLDVSVEHNGVWCDVTRTFFVGTISDEHKKAFNMVVKSIETGKNSLKTGVRACEIYNAVNGVFQQNGKFLIHHAGHRIGEDCLMQPQFLSKNETELRQFDFVAIESGLYEDFGIRFENNYYILKNEAEDLFSNLMPLKIEEYIL